MSPIKNTWFHILFALSRGPMHGSAIMEDVLDRTDGTVKLWPATLYGSLRDLEERRWIAEAPPTPGTPTEGGKRRFHALTSRGEEILREELSRMHALLTEARARDLLSGPAGGSLGESETAG